MCSKDSCPSQLGDTQEQRLQEAGQRLRWHSPGTAVTPELLLQDTAQGTKSHCTCRLVMTPEGFVSGPGLSQLQDPLTVL